MTDEDIDYSDIPELPDSFFARAKKFDSLGGIRLDPDVLEWFKTQSQEYPILINTVLRKYMELQQQVEEISA